MNRKNVMNDVCIILIVVLIVLVTVCCKTFENSYSIKARVNNVHGNVVTFEDVTGNVWSWQKEDKESFVINEEVTIYFNDNNTDVRYDDIIKSVKKAW